MKNEIFTSMYEQTQPKRTVINELILRAKSGDTAPAAVSQKPKVIAAAAAAVILALSCGIAFSVMRTQNIGIDDSDSVNSVTSAGLVTEKAKEEAAVSGVESASSDQVPEDTSAIPDDGSSEGFRTATSSSAAKADNSSAVSSASHTDSNGNSSGTIIITTTEVPDNDTQSDKPTDQGSSSVSSPDTSSITSHTDISSSKSDSIVSDSIPDNETDSTDDSVSDDYVDEWNEYSTIDEMAEYFLQGRNSKSMKGIFGHETQAAHPDYFTFYSGYTGGLGTVKYVRYAWSFVDIEYDLGNGSGCHFRWGICTEGEEYLKNAVVAFELSPIEGHDGWYGTLGEKTANIHWAEDGYYFNFSMPHSLYDECGLSLVKTNYYFQ